MYVRVMDECVLHVFLCELLNGISCGGSVACVCVCFDRWSLGLMIIDTRTTALDSLVITESD